MHQLIVPNIHRFKEGARVLEDLARFILKDEALFIKIKALKHSVIYPGTRFEIDTSAYHEQSRSPSLLNLAHANAIRMQEATRVLEEVYNKELFKRLRFSTYEIHQQLIQSIHCYTKRSKLKGIYAIFDPHQYTLQKLQAIVQQHNIQLIQLRMKSASKAEIIAAAKLIKAHLPDQLLIINDHLDIALAYADGVHLGQDDLPIEVAHQLAPSHFIIGITCKLLVEAERAIHAGASYLGVGCLFPSKTKPDAIAADMEMLKQIVAKTTVPVCAIGGINWHNFDQVKTTGVDIIAMGQALLAD